MLFGKQENKMELEEYYNKYRETLAAEIEGDFPKEVAACIAAGHYAGLSFNQLHKFMIRRTEISSVSVALVNSNTSVSELEKIIKARDNGCVSPKEVLETMFSPEDVSPESHGEIYGESNA